MCVNNVNIRSIDDLATEVRDLGETNLGGGFSATEEYDSGAIEEVVAEVSRERPLPLRVFDQVHMLASDVVRHVSSLAHIVAGKRVIFMGDSDCVALSLVSAGHLGLLPLPAYCLLCDFDERVLKHVEGTSSRFSSSQTVECIRYNVFDPVPSALLEQFDFFHTNPPYGQFNGGNSVIAFVERAMATVKAGGEGVILLANDVRYHWTAPVLQNVLQHIISKGITPFTVTEGTYRYHIDDQPDLRSGMIFCRDIDPRRALSPAETLPGAFQRCFYGRNTFAIPQYVQEDRAWESSPDG